MLKKSMIAAALLGLLGLAKPADAQRFGIGLIYPGDGKSTFDHLIGPPHFVPPSELAGLTQNQLDVMHTRLHRQRDRRLRLIPFSTTPDRKRFRPFRRSR